MGIKLRDEGGFSNFICFLLLFFIGAGAFVYYLTVGETGRLERYEPNDIAIIGFIGYGAIGLIFFLLSLLRRKGC